MNDTIQATPNDLAPEHVADDPAPAVEPAPEEPAPEDAGPEAPRVRQGCARRRLRTASGRSASTRRTGA
jgi:hypothetical protein